MIDEADNANEAIDAKEAEADKADAVEAEASVTDEAEARVADEADEADLTNDADAIDEVGAADDSIMIDKVVLGLLTLFVPFSLTKHSAIFAEVKGFFGININQLGSLKRGCLSPCSLVIRFVCGDENNNHPVLFEK
jgi:hypothetical protein